MKLTLGLVVIMICMSVYSVNADIGETSAGFLTLDAGAPSIGMGGAFTSLASGTDALFWNPGNLGWFDNTEIFIAHAEHFQSIRHEHLGIAHRFSFIRTGFFVKGYFVQGMEERTGPSQYPIATFGAYAVAPGITAAFPLGSKIGLGTNIKVILQNIATENSFSVAGDIGIGARDILGGLRFGLVLNDIGTGVTFIDRTFSLPTRVCAGLGYVFPKDRLLFEINVNKPFKDDTEFRVGCAVSPINRITLRIGYRSGLSANGSMAGFAGGIGLLVSSIRIDYAAALYGDLGLTHNLSLKYIVGGEKKIGEDEDRIVQELAKRARLTAETFYAQGVAQKNAGKYEEALQYYDMALIWYPDYTDAILAVKSVEQRIKEIKINEFLARGIAEFRSARYIEAILEFGSILAIDSSHTLTKEWMNASTNAMVKMHMEKVQHEQALQAQIANNLKRGMAFYAKEDFKAAVAEWNKILVLDPAHQEAREYISKALAQMAQQVARYLNNAQNYMNKQKWLAAETEINRALLLESQNQNALSKKEKVREQLRALSVNHTQEGIRLFKLKKYAAAETEFKMALHYESSNVTAKNYLDKMKSQEKPVSGGDINELYMKGVNAYTQEKYQLAIIFWKRVLEIDPDHSNALRNIKRAEEKLKINK